MWYVLCSLWAILLGSALVPVAYCLYHLIRSWSEQAESPAQANEPRPPVSPILYLTPVCIAALGRCARPSKLRNMTPVCIGRLLERFPFPEWETRPPAERYATWPDQARLLCAGKSDALGELQKELVGTLGSPTVPATEALAANGVDQAPEEASNRHHRLRLPALLALLLFLTSLLAWWIATHSLRCECSRTDTVTVETLIVDTPDSWTSEDLSTDLIFDFAMWEPRSPAHRAKLMADLRSLFRQFDGIKIRAVVAHTDPSAVRTTTVRLVSAEPRRSDK